MSFTGEALRHPTARALLALELLHLNSGTTAERLADKLAPESCGGRVR